MPSLCQLSITGIKATLCTRLYLTQGAGNYFGPPCTGDYSAWAQRSDRAGDNLVRASNRALVGFIKLILVIVTRCYENWKYLRSKGAHLWKMGCTPRFSRGS